MCFRLAEGMRGKILRGGFAFVRWKVEKRLGGVCHGLGTIAIITRLEYLVGIAWGYEWNWS